MIDRYTQTSREELEQLNDKLNSMLKDQTTSLRERCIDYSLRQSNNQSTIGELIFDAEMIYKYITDGEVDINRSYDAEHSPT